MVLMRSVTFTIAASALLQVFYILTWLGDVVCTVAASEITDSVIPDHRNLFVTLPMPSDDPQDTTNTTRTTLTITNARRFHFSNKTINTTSITPSDYVRDRAALLLPPSNDVQVEFMADDMEAASQIPELLRQVSSSSSSSSSLSSHFRHNHEETRQAQEAKERSSGTEIAYPFPRRTPRPGSSLYRPLVLNGASVKENNYHSPSQMAARGPWLLQQFPKNLTRVVRIEADCQEESMKIFVSFNGSFSGLIYSSGYANSNNCVYVKGSGLQRYTFIIPHNRCGTTDDKDLNGQDSYPGQPLTVTRNTLTVQYNPIIEEVWDEHFKVTCEYDYEFRKTVTFPMHVTVKTGDLREFTLRAPECKMEIREGLTVNGPLVNGPVRVGDPLTLIIYMTSQHENFDMVVSDCQAHNGEDKRIQLINSFGCPIDESLITGFQGSRTSVGAYHSSVFAFMKTFRFTGSRTLYLQCDVTMCLGRCPRKDPCHWRRFKRQVQEEQEEKENDEEEDREMEGEKNKGEDDASYHANMSESLRMTLEVIRDEQIFLARSDIDPGVMCLKKGTFSALAGVVAMVVGTLLVTSGVLCLRLRRAKKQEDDTTPKSVYSPSPGSRFVPPIKKRLP